MIYSRHCFFRNDKMYYMVQDGNYLAEYDIEYDVVRFYLLNINCVFACDKVYIKDKIYFFSISGNNAWIIDFETKNGKMISINCNRDEDKNYAYITDYNNEIIIFTRKMNKIVFISEFDNSIREEEYNKKYIFTTGCRVENLIYLFMEDGNEIVTYDVKKNEWGAVIVKEYSNIKSVFVSNHLIYILLNNNCINVFDCSKNIIVRTLYIPYQKYGNTIIIINNSKICIMPSDNMEFYLYDLETDNWEEKNNWPKDVCFDTARLTWSKFVGYCENDNFFYFANRSCNYFLRISKKTQEFIWTKPYFDLFGLYDKLMFSENNMPLSVYLNCVAGLYNVIKYDN